MAFLEINGLRKRFGSVEILKGIDLTLDKGGFLVLVGPSGCGKSTLLNTIAGLESVSAGEISIDGRSINDLHGNARRPQARARQGGGGGRQNAADRTSHVASTQPAIGRPTPARGDGSR